MIILSKRLYVHIYVYIYIYGDYASSLAYIVVACEPRTLKVSTVFVQNIMELVGGSQPAFKLRPHDMAL